MTRAIRAAEPWSPACWALWRWPAAATAPRGRRDRGRDGRSQRIGAVDRVEPLESGILGPGTGQARRRPPCRPGRWRSPGPRDRTSRRGPSGGELTLTFHGAGSADITQGVIDALAAADAKATIFAVGLWVAKDPAQVRRRCDAGHEIGNHTYDHLDMLGLDAATARDQIAQGQDILASTLGDPGWWFRPSGTSHSNETIRARRRGARVRTLRELRRRPRGFPGSRRRPGRQPHTGRSSGRFDRLPPPGAPGNGDCPPRHTVDVGRARPQGRHPDHPSSRLTRDTPRRELPPHRRTPIAPSHPAAHHPQPDHRGGTGPRAGHPHRLRLRTLRPTFRLHQCRQRDDGCDGLGDRVTVRDPTNAPSEASPTPTPAAALTCMPVPRPTSCRRR